MEILASPHAHSSRCWWHPVEARWVCSRAAEAQPEPPLVDTRDMLVVHTALLREFRLAAPAVERVAAGDRAAASIVDTHLGFVCDMLHHHHEGEDELLWPLLRDRLPESALAALDRIDDQHTGIDTALAAVGLARTAWTDHPDEEHRTALASQLRHLHDLLRQHLDTEERVALPLAASVVTDAEWNTIGKRAAAAMAKPDLLLAMGMFAYEGDPVVVRQMLAAAPAVVRFVVPRVGPRLYARRARAVHGTVRP
ncbi:hemerythrin domain-containing protein [Jatrophihabitans sp. YIM 134969]